MIRHDRGESDWGIHKRHKLGRARSIQQILKLPLAHLANPGSDADQDLLRPALAGAAGTQEAKNLARRDLEGNFVQSGRRPAGVGVAQGADLDRGVHLPISGEQLGEERLSTRWKRRSVPELPSRGLARSVSFHWATVRPYPRDLHRLIWTPLQNSLLHEPT